MINEIEDNDLIKTEPISNTLFLDLVSYYGDLVDILIHPSTIEQKNYCFTKCLNQFKLICEECGLYYEKLSESTSTEFYLFYNGKSDKEILTVLSYTIGSLNVKAINGLNYNLGDELQPLLVGLKALSVIHNLEENYENDNEMA